MMALGGGSFTTQNKVLPGSYLNFVSASKASASLAERGVAAMPISMQWGIDDEVFTIDVEDFQKDSLKIFGYNYTAEELKGLRDLFLNIKTAHFYKINSGGTKSENKYCVAKYSGSRGNVITTVITANENTSDETALYDIVTLFDGQKVDEQMGVANIGQLKNNDYCNWKNNVPLELTAGVPCTGGTDKAIADGNYQVFLDKIESYNFNTIGTVATSHTVKGLFVNWTKRMREKIGAKFQCVLFNFDNADYEGVVNVVTSDNLIYWATGALAGCEINKTLTNRKYDGEFEVETNMTQRELEKAIKAGKFVFHKVDDTVRVLEDINSFVSFSENKGADFSSNQTIRVLDQIANDIAYLFNTKYLGQVPNDNAGRVSLWGDIVKHHQKLEGLRAIEKFDPDKLKVEHGETKKSVVVTDNVQPVNAMAQLYMTVIIE